MREELRARWFESAESREARFAEEEEKQRILNMQIVKWTKEPQFGHLLSYVENAIISNEPTEDTINPLFKNGVVRGLRIVEAHLKFLRAKAEEIVNV